MLLDATMLLFISIYPRARYTLPATLLTDLELFAATGIAHSSNNESEHHNRDQHECDN